MDRKSLRFKKATINLGGKQTYANSWDVGDEVYQLKFVQKLPDKALGLCDSSTNTAYIRLKQSRIETFRTWLHEYLHAMEAVYGHELKHKDVEFLEIALSDFLIDNSLQLFEILFPKGS